MMLKLKTLSLLTFTVTLITACSGGSSNTQVTQPNEATDIPIIDSKPDTQPPETQNNPGEDSEAQEALQENTDINADTDTENGQPATDENESETDDTSTVVDVADNTDTIPESETDTPATTVEDETQSVEPENTVEAQGPVGFTNTTPFCQQAADRIQNSVELGMPAQEVRALVGKPMDTSATSLYWQYSDSTSPHIQFNNDPDGRKIVPGVVQAFDSDNSDCDGSSDALVEAANALALEGSAADRTNETPSCQDAGIRIQAFVEPDMTPEEVRALVGKPLQINAGGIIWQYDRIGGPYLYFHWETIDGVVTPISLLGWDSSIDRCN